MQAQKVLCCEQSTAVSSFQAGTWLTRFAARSTYCWL
uniref:Uncharacterized protein n=1 Tax=Anguilla anguilla TaxID=7936 RepID=A0A0E9W9I7_ANGAN